jgi:tRNA/tmRNA/rRNA uracil-C5-methylase (TrmA/RlmC/RlmD family)
VWYSASSRELKYDFQPINTTDILQKVASANIEKWRYKATPEVEHVGIIAEDFADIFAMGNNPESLNPLDVCGVLWAAVQELTKQVTELKNKIQ